jgi:hypothetical protein
VLGEGVCVDAGGTCGGVDGVCVGAGDVCGGADGVACGVAAAAETLRPAVSTVSASVTRTAGGSC